MNAYRAVIGGTLLLAAFSVFLFAILNDQGATALAAAELIGLVILDWTATAYIGWLAYRDRRRPRSWLLLMLVTSSVMMTLGLTLITFVLTRRLFGLPALDAGLGLRLIGIALLAIAYVPVMKASLFYLVQRDPSVHIGERLGDTTE